MNLKSSFLVFLIAKLNIIQICLTERTKDQMYEYFDGKASCFRRLNATHQIGCSSKRDGSTGIIHFVEKETDLAFILKKGNAGNYVPVIPTTFLTRKTLKLLKDSDKISGLVLYNDTSKTVTNYSHELSCPNPRSNIEKTCDNNWNKDGTGILHEDIPFPIYYVDNDEDLDKIKDCFHKFNNFSYETQYTRSLCSLELDAFMFATTDTPTCIRRSNLKINLNPVKFCDPLGDANVWASLFPIENATKNEIPNSGKYIVVATRLDTTSLFQATFPGAVNPVTGLVTFLATADLLKRMVSEGGSHDKNVLFILFNGETYDYIGSQRFVYDIEKDRFPMQLDSHIKNQVQPIHLEDISLFVEISQLTKSKALYAHVTNNTNIEVKNFYEKVAKYAIKFTKVHLYGIPLPPASLQSFLKANPNMSGLILADHGSEYVNKYYNSIYDNVSNINYRYYNISDGDDTVVSHESIQKHAANVSEVLAKSLYEQVMNKEYKGLQKPQLELIDELFYCYLLDPDCKVHQAVQKEVNMAKGGFRFDVNRNKLKDVPYNSYSLYVGVTVATNLLTYAIGLTLGWLTGDVVTLNRTCTNDLDTPMFQYINMSKSLDNLNTTVCIRTTMNFTEAVSPAFLIPDYDWKSGKYSSWAESTWRDFSVRMFLKPSAAHERFTIAIGSITLVMSMILVYFIKSRSHILFATPENCSPTSC